ncbi:DUF4153 domain-containing protein [Sphingomonas bacterium]|uniref:DUF4153 domain-containing protein n=1 Tax=Sphingomonas bacterium TaxID=1895847 RepID=UPI0026377BEB|nr:DUF4153 domain-containing protein [Sphingomonas bacterium]MDB5680181.1 hypothetical protein [Sphingomonas bacterium]
MTGIQAPQPEHDEPTWPQRAVILLVLGAIAALTVQQLMEPDDWHRYDGAFSAWRMATATGVGVGALAFGFGLARVRIGWTVAFAAALGVIAGMIVWWNSEPSGLWTWSGASMVLAIVIAVPLFQVARDEGRATFPYPQVHGHAWINIVLWGACWGFTGIVLLLSHLLGELFALIGIHFLKDVLEKSWSNALIVGAAFGAALALLRDRENVVRLLQRVVTSVLGFLAPILGIALLLFIVSLPFTGLNNLWEATKSTTPILMACVIGALVLANAVIGHGPDDEAKSPMLRWSALALGVSILPLAVIAAIAMGLRLSQYGATPDRLWGLTVVVFAVGYGLVYLTDLARKRLDWGPLIRRDNIRLAFATMAAALLLATPLLGFNAISVRDQVSRLERGTIRADKFDWSALQSEFGQPGLDAFEKLKHSPTPAIRHNAILAGESWSGSKAAAETRFEMNPAGTALAEPLKAAAKNLCGSTPLCRIFLQPDGRTAVVVSDGCADLTPAQQADPAFKCSRDVNRLVADGGKWQEPDSGPYIDPGQGVTDAQERKSLAEEGDAFRRGDVTVRAVERRQVFVGGKPQGPIFQ